ncbi:MAG: extracellular solute-binding protein [Alphaproteobacteria bacterium]
MTNPQILKDVLRHVGFSRRDVARWLPAAGLALATAPLGGPSARASGKPVVFEWSGYELPEFHPAYLAKHGESPDFSFFASQDEAFNKVNAGFTPDIVHPCASQAWKWVDAGFIKPIDVARLGNWPDVWPTLQNMPGVRDPSGENVVLSPFDWGNTSFCYRSDLVDITPETESWTAIIDPKYAGKISVDETEDNFRGVALAIGIKNVTSMTEEDRQKVKVALLEQKKIVRFYWESATDLANAMASGEIVVAVCWNETSATLKKQGIPVNLANPKEGVITWVCGLVHTNKGSADEQMVYDFMDAFLDPEAGRYLIDEYGYGHANTKSFDLVSPERLAELGISNPDDMISRSILSGGGQDFDSMMKIITEVQAGT